MPEILVICAVCQEKMSCRASICPHCGDPKRLPSEILIRFGALAGFCLLAMLEVLQITPRTSLLFWLLISLTCNVILSLVTAFATASMWSIKNVESKNYGRLADFAHLMLNLSLVVSLLLFGGYIVIIRGTF